MRIKGQGLSPRVRGTSSGQRRSTSHQGLSPRVRGNLIAACSSPEHPGSIPACAGEPGCSTAGRYSATVYPRVCGGTPATSSTKRTTNGLSPRVRGNLRRTGDDVHDQGSIPACAGEPYTYQEIPISNMVYPRVCGGTVVIVMNLAPSMGLSPRVRGNPPATIAKAGNLRSIPACAGEPG